jgi:hypothetical protein
MAALSVSDRSMILYGTQIDPSGNGGFRQIALFGLALAHNQQTFGRRP